MLKNRLAGRFIIAALLLSFVFTSCSGEPQLYNAVELRCEVESAWFNEFRYAYTQIPENIRNCMRENNVMIRIVDRDDEEFKSIAPASPSYSMSGYYMPPTITVFGDETEPAYIVIAAACQNIRHVLLHEVGHMISDTHTEEHVYKSLLFTQKFQNLYEKYENFVSFYPALLDETVYNESEFFAELFYLYAEDSNFMQNPPKGLSDFMQKYANEVSDLMQYAISAYLLNSSTSA